MKSKKQEKSIPNPGSEEAIKQKCKCAQMDNNYGKGGSYYGDGIWIYTVGCPVHQPEIDKDNETRRTVQISKEDFKSNQVKKQKYTKTSTKQAGGLNKAHKNKNGHK